MWTLILGSLILIKHLIIVKLKIRSSIWYIVPGGEKSHYFIQFGSFFFSEMELKGVVNVLLLMKHLIYT